MVRVYARQDGDYQILAMTGHASGSDVVCAACSAIAYTLMGWLANNPEKANVMTLRAESGSLRVAADGGAEMRAVFDAAVLGLMQIEAEYPDLVHVAD